MSAVAERVRLRGDAWADYAHATRGEHFVWWCGRHLVQSVGQFAGVPLVLEEAWQAPIMMEALSVDTAGRPFWRLVVIVAQRKNAKTTTLGGYSLYEADQSEGQPEVLLAGSTDSQSGRLFDTDVRFIRRSPYLSRRFHVRQHVGQVERADGGAMIHRVATTNADNQHGWNPSLFIGDELHAWTKPALREAWDALTTADGARDASQAFAITTPGRAKQRRTGILGPIVDGNRLIGDVERLPGCTISRNYDGRVIVFEFHAVDAAAADPRPLRAAVGARSVAEAEHGAESGEVAAAQERVDELTARLLESVRPANPASWIRDDDLVRKAIGPAPSPSAFLRLHAGLWADDEDAYIADETWSELGWSRAIADGRSVSLGIDGSRTHDTTVVSWSTVDGELETKCHVFSTREDVPHHELHRGGRIDYDRVEEFIEGLFARFRVVDAAYDPRYLDRSADLLRKRLPGAKIVPVEPTSSNMANAVAALERAAIDRAFRHDGDPVLAAHVANTVAVRSGGRTKLDKQSDDDVIDATVATALSVWRARINRAHGAGRSSEVVDVDLGVALDDDDFNDDDETEAEMIRRLRREAGQ